MTLSNWYSFYFYFTALFMHVYW